MDFDLSNGFDGEFEIGNDPTPPFRKHKLEKTLKANSENELAGIRGFRVATERPST